MGLQNSQLGVYQMGFIEDNPVFESMLEFIRGANPCMRWIDFETARGVYDQDYVFGQFDLCYNNGLPIYVKVWAAGEAPDADRKFTPEWLYSGPDGVDKVYITGKDHAYVYYPDYRNVNYKVRFQLMLDAMRGMILAYKALHPDANFLIWQCAIGTTGDNVPTHGDPEDDSYAFTEDEWNEYTRPFLVQFYSDLYGDIPATVAWMNPGNNLTNFDWAKTNISRVGFKQGDMMHALGFPGLEAYGNSYRAFTSNDQNLCGAELGDPNPGWESSPNGMTMALVMQCLHYNSTILKLQGAVYQSNTTSNDAYLKFNLHVGRIVEDKAMCYLAYMPDLFDVALFPESSHGPIVDPAQLTSYNVAYGVIIASDRPDEEKAANITKLKLTKFNVARGTSIAALYPGLSYQLPDKTRNGNTYDYDFNADSWPENLGKHIEQINYDNILEPVARVGDASSFWHRFGRKLTDKFYFKFNPVLIGDGTYSATFKIVFFDSGAATWRLSHTGGTTDIDLTDTGDFIEQTIEVTGLKGGLINFGSSDFYLELVSGDPVIFSYIELIDIALTEAPDDTVTTVADESVYDVDFNLKVTEDLPPDRRWPSMIAWVKSLISEIALDAYNLFFVYRLGSVDQDYESTTYNRRDRVIFNKSVYESLIDNNNDRPFESTWRLLQTSFIGSTERATYTGQKILLEYALNKWFGTTFRQPNSLSDIYIETNTVDAPVFRVGKVEGISSNVYLRSSSEGVVNGYSFGVIYNFTIFVPVDVYDSLGDQPDSVIRDFADKYVAAGITYNITTY